MKWIFLHNFTVQYVNKSIVNVKVLLNKNLVLFLALKIIQFLSRNGQDTGTSYIVKFHPVTLITQKGFWGKTTCRANLNWVFSLNPQLTTRISMLCIAKARRIVLQSCSLVHNTTSSGHLGHAIRGPFLRTKSHNFQVLQNRQFFSNTVQTLE